MELEHTTVKELKLLDSAAREQPVEFDLALPEYYPPVGRILKCFVTPTEARSTFLASAGLIPEEPSTSARIVCSPVNTSSSTVNRSTSRASAGVICPSASISPYRKEAVFTSRSGWQREQGE